ncbi:MAG: hypothetical protein P8144_12355 [Gammaproteobacteria bacterium]
MFEPLNTKVLLEALSLTHHNALNQASTSTMEITPWINWFCDSVMRAQKDALQIVDFILKKAKFWNQYQDSGFARYALRLNAGGLCSNFQDLSKPKHES